MNKIMKRSIGWIVFSFVAITFPFCNAYASAKTTQTTVQIELSNQNGECSSAVVKGGSEFSDEYLFWASDLADTIGEAVPYKSAGNIFVDVPDEYIESVTKELVDSISSLFTGESFSLSERGNTTVPAKYSGYHVLYSSDDNGVHTKVSTNGTIQNVVVHFVKADSVKYNEMGIVEGSISFSPDAIFNSKSEALEAMEKKKGYSGASVYKSENYSFTCEDNSIVSLSGSAIAELSSFRPTMTVLDGGEIINEGTHIVQWKYDSKVFSKPIVWYEVYVGVSESVLAEAENNQKKDDLIRKEEFDRENLSIVREDSTRNITNNENKKQEDSSPNKVSPFVFGVFILVFVFGVYIIVKKKAHYKYSEESTQHTSYYNGDEFDENIIDVDYVEVNDEKKDH